MKTDRTQWISLLRRKLLHYLSENLDDEVHVGPGGVQNILYHLYSTEVLSVHAAEAG